MTAHSFSQRDIDRALSAAVKHGLTVRRYKIATDGSIEVECAEAQADALPASLVDWSRPK